MHTVKEFCELAKINTRQFDTLKAQGLGPDLVRLGRSVRITHEAAAEWINARAERTA
ncbi:hypothetical protein [Tunturiibacter gelidiferens]|uniref:hypothetical protein n=1 Tax=Tunturiibacter gelidiferens TaxID=3069689 RepID=UPI003D9BF431